MSSEKLKRVVLKEEMVAVTGDAIKGLVLNQMVYWTEILNESDREIQKQIEEYKKLGLEHKVKKAEKQLRNGWFWKSAQELSEELMGISSRGTIDRKLKELITAKFIESRKNPKNKMDKTNHYRVDLNFLRTELKKLGYTLDGYAIPKDEEETKKEEPEESPESRIAQNEQSEETLIRPIAQNEQSNAQNEQSTAHSEQTIPEITSETSSQTTFKNQNLNLSEQLFTMKLPMPLKKFFSKQVSVLVNDSFDIDIVEEFYNTSEYVRPDCTKEDVNWVNDYEFNKIVKWIFENVDRPIINTHGLLKNFVLRFLSFKLDGKTWDLEDNETDEDFWNTGASV